MIEVVKVAVVSLGLMSATTMALAQVAVEVGSDVELHIGKDVAAGHASQGKVGVNSGNVSASGAVADGLRIGDSKFQSGVHGSVSAPTAAVAGALAN